MPYVYHLNLQKDGMMINNTCSYVASYSYLLATLMNTTAANLP